MMEANFRDDPLESDSGDDDYTRTEYDWRREKWLDNRNQFISDEITRVGVKAVMAATKLVRLCEERQTQKNVLLRQSMQISEHVKTPTPVDDDDDSQLSYFQHLDVMEQIDYQEVREQMRNTSIDD